MNDDRFNRRRGPAGAGGPAGGRRKFIARRKVCGFCVEKVRTADYKDIKRLQRYVSDRGKILPRRRTGTCARHQRGLTTAIKRARHLALLPFAAAHTRG
jgi:small subunit ribosomal protein S18